MQVLAATCGVCEMMGLIQGDLACFCCCTYKAPTQSGVPTYANVSYLVTGREIRK